MSLNRFIPSASRLRAFFCHLSFSAFLGLFALTLVLFVWYPAPLQKAAGVMFIFLLLLGVDVTLGPCLTFAVAKPGKKKHLLLLDLTVILTVQLAAYFYGLYTVAAGRPAWLVISESRSDIVRAADLDPAQLSKAPPEYQHPPLNGPQWVCAPMPEGSDAQNKLLDDSMAGMDIYMQPQFFRPLPECGSFIQGVKSHPLEELNSFNDPEEVKKQLAAYPDADAFMPLWVSDLEAESRDMVTLLYKKEGRVLGVVDLRPEKPVDLLPGK